MSCILLSKANTLCKWGNYLSDTFSVSNVIKQMGILSPMLFNIYVDDLSTALNKCNVGCYFNAIVLNHLYYAADMCLLYPSVHGLNELLYIGDKYATYHDIIYNECKNVCLYFKPLHFKIQSMVSGLRLIVIVNI